MPKTKRVRKSAAEAYLLPNCRTITNFCRLVLLNVTSGGATINDGFWHAAMNQTPIGGVGSSGQGNYHGVFSFKAFSHERIICKVPKWADLILKLRYMPYDMTELKRSQMLTALKPNFDRNGRTKYGLFSWIAMLFTLGGKSKKSSILRWATLLAFVAFYKLRQGGF